MSLLCFGVLVFSILTSSSYAKRSQLIQLRDENWRDCLTGEWLIKFYAPWCPACKDNEPQFEEFSTWSDDLGIKVATVDITEELGLSGRFMVTALPTFYHAIDGEFRRYNGDRSSDSMHTYIEQKTWQNHEIISWMRHPDSFGMTLMSWLFKTSVIMKNIHESLMEDYGLSLWMSYAVFGIGTVITGLVLGFILVCIVDVVFPQQQRPNKSAPARPKEVRKESGDGDGRKMEDYDSQSDEQDWETIKDKEIQGSDGTELYRRKPTADKEIPVEQDISTRKGGKDD
uniref:Thioredoxin domain-containing protein n=1 Tax=Ciona savignyi TaxID=51511 RepID=H2ZNI5_CIOSA